MAHTGSASTLPRSLQRLAVIAIGVVFLIAGIHNPGRLGAGIYAGLTIIVGLFGAVTAMRHVWIQSLPKDEVPPADGPQLHAGDPAARRRPDEGLQGQRQCAEAGWRFLGLAIPSWTLVFFVAMMVAAVVLIRRTSGSAGRCATLSGHLTYDGDAARSPIHSSR